MGFTAASPPIMEAFEPRAALLGKVVGVVGMRPFLEGLPAGFLFHAGDKVEAVAAGGTAGFGSSERAKSASALVGQLRLGSLVRKENENP